MVSYSVLGSYRRVPNNLKRKEVYLVHGSGGLQSKIRGLCLVGAVCHVHLVGALCHLYQVGTLGHMYLRRAVCHVYLVEAACHMYFVGVGCCISMWWSGRESEEDRRKTQQGAACFMPTCSTGTWPSPGRSTLVISFNRLVSLLKFCLQQSQWQQNFNTSLGYMLCSKVKLVGSFMNANWISWLQPVSRKKTLLVTPEVPVSPCPEHPFSVHLKVTIVLISVIMHLCFSLWHIK